MSASYLLRSLASAYCTLHTIDEHKITDEEKLALKREILEKITEIEKRCELAYEKDGTAELFRMLERIQSIRDKLNVPAH